MTEPFGLSIGTKDQTSGYCLCLWQPTPGKLRNSQSAAEIKPRTMCFFHIS